ncbi:hypothetical protein KAV67_00370, partial [Candidatus Bipolaricaulota bacterium]|nr:hypothetical protein [Candidatus Bipolaricaulota bacterium]
GIRQVLQQCRELSSPYLKSLLLNRLMNTDIDSIYILWLVLPVFLASLRQPNEPNELNEPNEPNKLYEPLFFTQLLRTIHDSLSCRQR